MKPHLFLAHTYASSGYQQWQCRSCSEGHWGEFVDGIRGLGATPAAAYADWKRMQG